MKKTLVISVVIMLILCTIVVGATPINREFQGFPIVKVDINGEPVNSEVPAVNFYGKTVLPVRDIAETFKAIVDWNGETWTANLIKPEVDMTFFDTIEEDENGIYVFTNAFKLAPVGTVSMYSYADIDGLSPGTYQFRIVIVNPQGDIIYSTQEDTYEIKESDVGGFYIINYFEDVVFGKQGDYKFQFQLKYNGTFKSVYEKTLIVY